MASWVSWDTASITFPKQRGLTRLKPQRVREWLSGGASGPALRPVFRSDYPPVGGDRAISFHDLIELLLRASSESAASPCGSCGTVHQTLQDNLRTKHPFCQPPLLTRGGEAFTISLDEQSEEEMIEALSAERAFPDILLPFLQRIEYDEATELARRWCIADQVVIDPAIGLGKPTIDGIGIATAILAASYEANNKNAEVVADWFRVHPSHVLAAVDFERSLAA